MNVFFKAVFYFFLALVFALFEVELEGKYGWAEKSQTWRVSPGRFPLWLRSIFPKPLTGYHIFIFLAAVLVAHMSFFSGVAWSWQAEFQALSLYFAWTPLWDYLWFVFNPQFGIKRLGPNAVWWYKDSWWVGGVVPFENVLQWVLSLIFAYLGSTFADQVFLLALLSGMTVVSTFTLAPMYIAWNTRMHKLFE